MAARQLGHDDIDKRATPPHGSTVLKLTQQPGSCRPQSLTFNEIADWTFNNPPPALSVSASSGLPVQYEVVFGPATVDKNGLHPTGESGTVYVVATQTGDQVSCAAIPQLQSFRATGPHQDNMFLFGSFTNWTPVRMHLEGDNWVAHNLSISAGTQQYKFANTNNFTGTDWGNVQGLAGTATVTTGGGPNGQVNLPQAGFYIVTFNDVTLQVD